MPCKLQPIKQKSAANVLVSSSYQALRDLSTQHRAAILSLFNPTLFAVFPSKNPSLHPEDFFVFHPWRPWSHNNVIYVNIQCHHFGLCRGELWRACTVHVQKEGSRYSDAYRKRSYQVQHSYKVTPLHFRCDQRVASMDYACHEYAEKRETGSCHKHD